MITRGEFEAFKKTGLFPSGTKMVFCQASAPPGWTQDTSINDKVLRVVNGEGGGMNSAGSHSHTVNSHRHSTPNHTHYLANTGVHYVNKNLGASFIARSDADEVLYTGSLSSGDDDFYIVKGKTTNSGGGNTGYSSPGTNSTGSHSHSFDGTWRPAYLDVIVCTKD